MKVSNSRDVYLSEGSATSLLLMPAELPVNSFIARGAPVTSTEVSFCGKLVCYAEGKLVRIRTRALYRTTSLTPRTRESLSDRDWV